MENGRPVDEQLEGNKWNYTAKMMTGHSFNSKATDLNVKAPVTIATHQKMYKQKSTSGRNAKKHTLRSNLASLSVLKQ